MSPQEDDAEGMPLNGNEVEANREANRPYPIRTRSSPLATDLTGAGADDDQVGALRAPEISLNSPTSPRHRSHTVSVSFAPQNRQTRSASKGMSAYPDRRGSGSQQVDNMEAGPSTAPAGSTSMRDRRRSSLSNRSGRRFSLKRRSADSAAEEGLARRPSLRSNLDLEDDPRAGTPVSFELESGDEDEELDDSAVGVLDVIDPHVSTVNHFQNMSNSLIFPHFPALWNRRPEVLLPETPDQPESTEQEQAKLSGQEAASAAPASPLTATTGPAARRSSVSRKRASTVSRLFPPSSATPPSANAPGTASEFGAIPENGLDTLPSPSIPSAPTSSGSPISPTISEGSPSPQPRSLHTQPIGTPLQKPLSAYRPEHHDPAVEAEMRDIEAEIEKDHLLDAHVRHVLLSQKKKDKLRQIGRGLWTFLKTPMGIFTAVYGFLVAFWGAAIVLFLLGWIPTSSKYVQDLWVERSSQIENGLFTLTGIGLIPWRVIDTYRMAKIWHLRVETHKRRKARGLPPIEDPNDLPDPKEAKDYISVLTGKEQEELHYQQTKFAKSQTWYRPHATATHRAFPIKWALFNTLLMDGNSFFQAFLCGTMWGINWHHRPAWTTGILIPLSFLCGIGAGVLIWQGSARTKKTIQVKDKLREALMLPLAVGIPRTEDGTVIIAGSNQAPNPNESNENDSEKTATSSPGKKTKKRWFRHRDAEKDAEAHEMKEDKRDFKKDAGGGIQNERSRSSSPTKTGEGRLDRRATVTFGTTPPPSVMLGDAVNRPRGVTVAAADKPLNDLIAKDI